MREGEGHCVRCGRCCTIILSPVAKEDAERLGVENFTLRQCPLRNVFEIKRVLDSVYGQRCIFMVPPRPGNGKQVAECLIYDNRPGLCRGYFCSRAAK